MKHLGPLLLLLTATGAQAQFSAEQFIEQNELPNMGVAVIVDLNGDGANDVLSNASHVGLAHFMNDGMGNFGEVQFDDTTSFEGHDIMLATGDVDNDGDA